MSQQEATVDRQKFLDALTYLEKKKPLFQHGRDQLIEYYVKGMGCWWQDHVYIRGKGGKGTKSNIVQIVLAIRVSHLGRPTEEVLIDVPSTAKSTRWCVSYMGRPLYERVTFRQTLSTLVGHFNVSLTVPKVPSKPFRPLNALLASLK